MDSDGFDAMEQNVEGIRTEIANFPLFWIIDANEWIVATVLKQVCNSLTKLKIPVYFILQTPIEC